MPKPHAGYDETGNKCSGKAQQGTVNLAHALLDVFGGRSLGIFSCRLPSEHGEGRAFDHAWRTPSSGWRIAHLLVDNNAALGVEQVIWQDQIWSFRRPYWHDYDGPSDHRDHIHTGQNWSGALWLQYADAVRLLGGHPAPPPPPTIEGLDSMLPKCVHWNGAIFLVGYDPEPFDILAADNKTVVGTAVGPWRKTFENMDRLQQVVGGGAAITDHGNAFEVTNNQFESVYQNRGKA